MPQFFGYRQIPGALIAFFLAIGLGGCGLPKGGEEKWTAIDGNPNCAVWGVWDRYTWTGPCLSGRAEGLGSLQGFSGSTEMMRYSGKMTAGLRNGQGTLWINNDEIHGGPETKVGMFIDGNFVSGSESNSKSTFSYANGVSTWTSDHEPAQSSSGLGAIASALGVAANIAAGSAGSNSANYQALGQALHSVSGNESATAGVGASPYEQYSQNSPTSSSAKSCNFSTKTLRDAIAQCKCEGGQGRESKNAFGDSHFSCRFSKAARNWGCQYGSDGQHGCGAR